MMVCKVLDGFLMQLIDNISRITSGAFSHYLFPRTRNETGNKITKELQKLERNIQEEIMKENGKSKLDIIVGKNRRMLIKNM